MPTDLVGLWPLQPTAGRFEVVDDEVRFRPRFPFVPGTSYSLLVDGVEVAAAGVPAPTITSVTSVVALYPTAREVPLNLLKLYVQFSAPMSEGWAGRAVQVRRADDGRPWPGVFLPMEPELWDHARQRLTLLLDPGRIKRGLAPHTELGYPLENGVSIAVTVDRSFRDARGVPLAAGLERRYDVGPAIRRHVLPSEWRIHPPGSHSIEPLHVEFDRPLDRALLEHRLTVVDARGRPVEGSPAIADGERGWRFTPRRPWPAEAYRLCVDARLEDLAGNSLSRVFDRDLTRPADAPIDIRRAEVEFRPV